MTDRSACSRSRSGLNVTRLLLAGSAALALIAAPAGPSIDDSHLGLAWQTALAKNDGGGQGNGGGNAGGNGCNGGGPGGGHGAGQDHGRGHGYGQGGPGIDTPHRALQERQGSLAIAAFDGEHLEHFAFVVDDPPGASRR